ncbi:hypothetical protein SAMN02745824_2724 [Parasphingorhabdus marina DSM 22363]|uniref:Secreted protein n=1 Tax=Parasphingorhabdus marina DSM 22363 TaxID=1123272 RepID=A0A1N6G8Q7_9SPHN|nr:DUF6607 family protein [Parasphingorhabdus marina]SIO03897.1 hypothetical protein SAMN02745824_2724 [Parasphingorhabdus marina DSM 22363]
MTTFHQIIGTALFAMTLATSPALADDPIEGRTAQQEQASFAADRADILAMAGNYKVTFDMQETTAWHADYEPIKAKISGGHESVHVIEDTGRKIVLQHLLVVGSDEDPFIVKHWRQDWEYEPEQILAYAGPNTWVLKDVPERLRKGRWSQTVYQVDDSPRYAGWGQWTTTNGVRRWRSNWTQRPLARRDATRNPVYDRYSAINRHQPMPGGWIHWQDNTKMGLVEGKLVPIVQESVLNTYRKFDGYPVAAADRYWEQTQGYWKAVRDEWDAALARTGGISIEEEAETGTVISGRLLEMGTRIAKGEMSESAAIAEARNLIRTGTSDGLAKTAQVTKAGDGY